MLSQLLLACGITVALVGAWVGVQALVRRNAPGMGPGDDVLACRMCGADGSCTCGLKQLIAKRSGIPHGGGE